MGKVTNFPNGISTEGKALKMGAGEVTGATLDVPTGLKTIQGAVATINEAPGAASGDVYQVTTTFSGGTLTISIWQDDSTVATEDTSVSWVAWGIE